MWKLSIAVSILLASLAVSIANASLPELSHYFNLTFAEVRWVVLAYLLSNTLLIVNGSYFGDFFGRRRTLFLGIILFSLSSGLAASATSLDFLVLSRFIQGVGGALIMSMSLALLGDLASKGKVGSTIGIAGSMSAAGTLLGPSMGSLLIYQFGWRSLFFSLGVLGLFNAILIYQFVPEVKSNPGHQKLSFEKFSKLNIGFNLLRNTILSTIMMTTTVVGPFYLTNTLKLSVIEMGLVMSVGPITSFIMGYTSGVIVDRFSAEKVANVGLYILLAGAMGFTFLPSVFATKGFMVAAISLSSGYQLFLAANNTSVISRASSENRGLAAGLIGFSRNLGLLAGAGVMGAIFSLFGFEVVFLTAAILVVILIFLRYF
jgi:MFS family permease